MRLVRKFIGVIFSSMLMLLMGSCIEYTITTQVLPDGSLLRIFVMKGDSLEIMHNLHRLGIDTSWQTTTRFEEQQGKDSVSTRVFVFEARKKFADYQALNSALHRDSASTGNLNTRVTLEKKWKWFYTDYIYRETYGMAFPFHGIPVDRYLTPTQLAVYFAGDKTVYYSRAKDSLMLVPEKDSMPKLAKTDSIRMKQLRDTLELRFEQWQRINIYDELFETVSKAMTRMDKPVDSIQTRHDFYNYLDSVHVLDALVHNPVAFVETSAKFFHVDPKLLEKANSAGFRTFTRKFSVPMITAEVYYNRVLMPGIITQTNTTHVQGNLATWHFSGTDFYAHDFSMIAVSRAVNQTFVTVFTIVLVILIGILTFVLVRRKSKLSGASSKNNDRTAEK